VQRISDQDIKAFKPEKLGIRMYHLLMRQRVSFLMKNQSLAWQRVKS